MKKVCGTCARQGLLVSKFSFEVIEFNILSNVKLAIVCLFESSSMICQ